MGALTATFADDLNNWGDALSLQRVLLKTFTDTLNNWADLSVLNISYHPTVSDSLNSWQDSLGNLFSTTEFGVSDTISMSDAVLVLLAGQYAKDVNDSLNNFNDAIVLLGQGHLQFSDILDNWNDEPETVINTFLNLVDNLDNWSDLHVAEFIGVVLREVNSNLDSWTDSITNEFLSRLAVSKRSGLIPYLRRYLNDVETPIVKEIHISVTDSNSNNWKDSAG